MRNERIDPAGAMEPAELRAWRLRLGLSQRQLAKLFHVGHPTVMHWESGTFRITAPGAIRLALERLSERDAGPAAIGARAEEAEGRLSPATLREDRIRLGISQGDFARLLGLSVALLSSLERDPALRGARTAARALLDKLEDEAAGAGTAERTIAPWKKKARELLTDEDLAVIATDPTRAASDLARELGRSRATVYYARVRILRQGWACPLTWKVCRECGQPLAVPSQYPQRNAHLKCEEARRLRVGLLIPPERKQRPGRKPRASRESLGNATPQDASESAPPVAAPLDP